MLDTSGGGKRGTCTAEQFEAGRKITSAYQTPSVCAMSSKRVG
jgi:hypothetical protein